MTPKSLTLSDSSIIVLPNENLERTGFRTKREVNWITSVFPGLQSNMFCVFQFITALTHVQFRRVAKVSETNSDRGMFLRKSLLLLCLED